ncbi:AraC family transcriptional regulator [Dokdonia sp.]|uniref:helix-turn-helix domain-containing protein n=1 Tax=Dokdonia sp. TaxID=2024995 RepID=UPI00326409DF
MRLEYEDFKDESSFVVTNFNCDPSQYLLKRKGSYKIVWSNDKDVTIGIDGYEIVLKKDQMIFCTPLNVLDIPKEDGLIAIVFNREFYCIRDHDEEVSCNGFLFFGSSTPPIITLNKKDTTCFQAMFYILEEEFEEKDHIQGEMLRVLLKRILIKSSRLIRKELNDVTIPSTQLDIVRRYNVLVEKHFREKHQVADYADMLHKTPKTLSTLFKKMGDALPLTIINDRILLEAKRLLLYSDKTAKEIAYELGYNESGHFSRFFKKKVGLSPSKFREKKFT